MLESVPMTVLSAHPAGPARPATRDRAPVPAGRAFALLLTLAGLIGLIASAVLTFDKIRLLADPSYVPSCNINPVISCGSVMRTAQAEVFGFPNPLLGVAAFAMVLAVGAGSLAGAAFRRWFWLGLQLGAAVGLAFTHWLIVQALYRIGALCPYCMVVWAVTIALFWYVTLHNLRTGVVPVPARPRAVVREAVRYHWVVPALWYAVIALLVLNRFWYYWRTLL
ncbi:membrane protein [Kitasatospora herbaricolor]|uniref:vitamin K epoxide reductase family protein n=1 Tax=Kitasatospora herbaricolor TaxID=68217 RepID=UPI00174AF888|nr:vitamin K epoxide reductase family protein [Kitasatospora herbaricolor]MDQ0312303.1 putative membrane protein [Kitasatospora herbaricolor]GGV14936.1 membrane protein [Kitasatospora herbaricolor]